MTILRIDCGQLDPGGVIRPVAGECADPRAHRPANHCVGREGRRGYPISRSEIRVTPETAAALGLKKEGEKSGSQETRCWRRQS
jgi:hypothetical protein